MTDELERLAREADDLLGIVIPNPNPEDAK